MGPHSYNYRYTESLYVKYYAWRLERHKAQREGCILAKIFYTFVGKATLYTTDGFYYS